MPTYEQSLGGNVNLGQAHFRDWPPQASPGRQFVWNCRRQMLTPRTNMNQLNARFHQFLRNRNWTWDPGVPGATYAAGARLLDGTVNRGECGFPAYALAYMINAPQPYGFDVGGAQVVTFGGQHNAGFIANHAHALPGPQPNVTRPQGATLQGFYYWDNHKVVQFNGHFYDPCYDAVYGALPGMAVASLQVVRQNVRLRDLEMYDPLSPWGLLLAWGLPRLMALKLSDAAFSTTHTISVTVAANVLNPAVAGHYVEWAENWGNWVTAGGGRGHIYGPFNHNPLVR